MKPLKQLPYNCFPILQMVYLSICFQGEMPLLAFKSIMRLDRYYLPTETKPVVSGMKPISPAWPSAIKCEAIKVQKRPSRVAF